MEIGINLKAVCDIPDDVFIPMIADLGFTATHDMARPRKSHVEYEDTGVTDATNSTIWSEWIDVRTLIDALPTERREALILTQVLGYTYEEAAKIAGVRVGTIRSRVARARADLINATSSALDDEETGTRGP